MLQNYDQDSSYDNISDTQKYIIILGTSLGMKYQSSSKKNPAIIFENP